MATCATSAASRTLIMLSLAAAIGGCARSQAQDNGAPSKAPTPPRCAVETITNKFWMGCSEGVCRNLLLRSDGTYQLNMLNGGSARGVYCQSGTWSLKSKCTTIQLDACDGTSQAREWKVAAGVLSFGNARYEQYKIPTKEAPFFVGCRVRRFCAGLSCGELLGCLQECASSIIERAECPSECFGQIAPKHQDRVSSLQSCLVQSNCGEDEACGHQACAEEYRRCD